MFEQTIDLAGTAVKPNKPSDYTAYDKPDIFSGPEKKLVLDRRVMKNQGKLLDLHDFMPWGWTLDFPILRDFNVAAGRLYGGEIAFYAMRGIKFSPQKDTSQTILEQLADKWLEIYSSQGGPKELVVTGASLGALFSMIIASKAKSFNLHIPHVYLNEPAGVTPKSLGQMRKQATQDTQFEFDYSAESLGKRNLRLDTARYVLGNLSNELKIVKEIGVGTLPQYVNQYLADTDGQVHLFHGAESSFITNQDLELFDLKLVQPNRVKYSHITDLRHGVGPQFMQLATWFMEYITDSQR